MNKSDHLSLERLSNNRLLTLNLMIEPMAAHILVAHCNFWTLGLSLALVRLTVELLSNNWVDESIDKSLGQLFSISTIGSGLMFSSMACCKLQEVLQIVHLWTVIEF